MGDLLGMGGQKLEFSKALKEWIGKPQFLVFNLEAQIYSKTHLPLLRQSFKNEDFFKSLARDFHHSRLVAGVANNHFHDFSELDRLDGFKKLEDLGYTLVGERGCPSLSLASGLQLHCHTAWIDRAHGVAGVEDLDISHASQHLLFLHAGVEFSVDPDHELMEFEKKLPPQVLALIGHHTHRPSGIEQTSQRLVAWSLGNICTPFGGDPVRWGQVLKLRLKKSGDTWSVSDGLWSYLYCRETTTGAVVELAPAYAFHEKINSPTIP